MRQAQEVAASLFHQKQVEHPRRVFYEAPECLTAPSRLSIERPSGIEPQKCHQSGIRNTLWCLTGWHGHAL